MAGEPILRDQQVVQRMFAVTELSEEQLTVSAEVTAYYQDLANLILVRCPSSREKSLAMTNLEESLSWALKAVARGGG